MIDHGLALKIFGLNALYLPFVSVVHYLGLETEALALFCTLLVIDLITGVLKVLSLKQKPKSWRFANGLISKGVLLLIPLSIAVAAKAVHIDLGELIYLFISALILSELYSIIANIYTIHTGKEAEEFDVLSLLLKKIRTTINMMLGDK